VSGGPPRGGNTGDHTSEAVGGSSGGAAKAGAAGDATAEDNVRPSCPETTLGEWLAIASSNAPTPRTNEWVIATDDGMLVWGGLGLNSQGAASAPYFDNGAIYHLCDDSWSSISTAGAPSALTAQTSQPVPTGIWTGNGLIVWGGIDSAATISNYPEGAAALAASLYDAASDTWKDMNRSGEPTARGYEARVWTGEQLLIWGGVAQSGDKSWANHQDGALFDPVKNRWTPMSTNGAPEGRAVMQQYVWTGSQFIVWGGFRFETGTGFDPVYTAASGGGIYDVATDTWTSIAALGAPTHAPTEVFWTGSRMLVLALLDGRTTPGELAFDGALFDPAANRWSKMSAPDPSLAADFVWSDGSRRTFYTGKALVMFGERINDSGSPRASNVALVYDPATDHWRGAELPAKPAYGTWQVAELIEGKIVYGGAGPLLADSTGADHLTTQLTVFDPEAMTFSDLPLLRDRAIPHVVGSAHHLLAWGGQDTYTDLNAPDPCRNATGPCDPVTPTRTLLRGDGVALGL